MRKRIGTRNHSAIFERHNGAVDAAGNPTYHIDTDWTPIQSAWPVEFTATSGSEDARGRQVTAETTHVIYGEYYGAGDVTPLDRCKINGLAFGIVSINDPDGLQMEKRAELKRIING